ncbi:hypothetical protein DM02DRAFT_659645, partial [Periconia macrospinosa]
MPLDRDGLSFRMSPKKLRQAFHPLRPKRPADDQTLDFDQSPLLPGADNSDGLPTATHTVPSVESQAIVDPPPSVDPPTFVEPPAFIEPQVIVEPPTILEHQAYAGLSSSYTAGQPSSAHAATASQISFTPTSSSAQQEPVGSFPPVPNHPVPWPSEVATNTSTMWLLPPYTDQSSAIASLLRTEIQSHNITKEMLHNTEQRRLDAVGRCGRLEADVNVLNIAYTKASTSLQKCAE